MKRLMLATGLAGLAVFPSAALAAPSRAKVLSVDARHHTVQLVNATHLVRGYDYRGKLPRLGLGDTVSYRRSGRTISHVKKTARASGTISFYAKVVRSGAKKVQLRLGDGKPLSLSSKQVSTRAMAYAAGAPTQRTAHAAAASPTSVTLQIQGLAPGETVLISETVDAHGHWTITVTLPASSTIAGGGTTTGDGSGEDPGDDQVAEGTITQVSGSRLAVATDSGQLSFSVDPDDDLTDGFLVGDLVDVSYFQNGDGTLSADDVEYVEDDATGVVSTVSDGAVIIVDDSTGQTDTFSADPDMDLFDGIAPGDEVDVTYHQAAAGDVADAVGDDAWDS
jgi:Domain of unknown function (DUF5666)